MTAPASSWPARLAQPGVTQGVTTMPAPSSPISALPENPRAHRRCGGHPQGRHLPDQETAHRSGCKASPVDCCVHASGSQGRPRSSGCSLTAAQALAKGHDHRRRAGRGRAPSIDHPGNPPADFSGSSRLRPSWINAPRPAPRPHARSGSIEPGARPASGMRSVLEHRQRCPPFALLQSEEQRPSIPDIALSTAFTGHLQGNRRRMIGQRFR